MTNIDLILLFLMLGFFIWGAFKGLIWTVIRFASYIGAFVIISASGEQVRDFIVELLKVSPFIGMVISYILLFIFMMILGQLVYFIVSKIFDSLKLGFANRLAGGVFWSLAILLIMSFVVILIDVSPLSLNGRGVRSSKKGFDFELITDEIDKLLEVKKEDIPDVNKDLLQEAVEKAEKKFSDSDGLEEQKQVVQELYKSISLNLGEQNFSEAMENIDIKKKDNIKFEGKKIELDSFVLDSVIEPIADYLEEKLLKLK